MRPWLIRDPYLAYTAALSPIAGVVLLAAGRLSQLAVLVVLTVMFVTAQAVLGMLPPGRRPLPSLAWSLLRVGVSLLFAAAVVELGGGPAGPMIAIFLPVAIAAAAIGPVQGVVAGALTSAFFLLPQLDGMLAPGELTLRGMALAGVTILLAVGARQLVEVVERTSRKLRSAMRTERRRSRQISGLEEASRLLVSAGPTPETLDRVLGVLVDRFGYNHVSIYLADGDLLVLGAQRGYREAIPSFDGSRGVVGRTMRTRRLQFVPDVTADPDYISVFDEVRSEICAPLLVDGQLLGILNVEARERLDRTDRDLVATLADRVATMLAVGRDRQALAERAAIFRSLHEFTQAVSGTLDRDRLALAMVDAARRVVRADVVVLTVLDRETGRYHVRAVTDGRPEWLGVEVRPGQSLSGRAILTRAVVVDAVLAPDDLPEPFRALVDRRLLGAGIPLVRDGTVMGALSLLRRDVRDAFRPIEREAMALLGGHAALALANAFLHAEVQQLAIRDPLTGLYNRRYFDEALERAIASWHRTEPALRRPVSAILFDLDHFGEFNKQHGHQVGDVVLRSFARILRDRFRASDLVARLGGEEFIVVLDGASRDQAERIAHEVRASLAALDLVDEDGRRLAVTVSAGCIQLDDGGATREQLLRSADVAMFMAKRAGRDRVVAA
ncbi:MAG TPA: diguanylate cyclase [candidate division Zixibacteria bacterium]|nr:diguanylate cyclase [candidate division Zixibacteria bacterium]